jgi:hypothetical protein
MGEKENESFRFLKSMGLKVADHIKNGWIRTITRRLVLCPIFLYIQTNLEDGSHARLIWN